MSEEKAKYAGKTAEEWEAQIKDQIGCVALTGFFGYLCLALGIGWYLGAGAFFLVMAVGLLASAFRFWFTAKVASVKQKKAEESQND